MRCNFETTKTLSSWNTAVIVSLAVFGSSALAAIDLPIVAAVFGILFLLTIPAAIFLSFFHGGVIRARGKQVIISHNFMSGNAFVSYIRYNEIAYAEYHVETRYSRYRFDSYELILVINKKSGKSVKLSKKLDIRESFPTNNPDGYKEMLTEQPLIKMCKYINERSRLL